MTTFNDSIVKLNLVVVIFFISVFSQLEIFGQADHIGTSFKLPPHPRILIRPGNEQDIQRMIAADIIWSKMHQALSSESDNILLTPPLERIQIGRRLLGTSREAFRRIFFLSYSYHLTQRKDYLQRAERELLTISGFTNWNPSHFLDVAEMTMAAAIGYD